MPRELTVAFYTDAREIGGAELSIGNLLQALPPRIAATVVGISPAVVARLAERRENAEAVVVSEVRSMLDLGAVLAHCRAFRRIRPHVVHVSLNHPWACTWAQLAAMITRRASVVVVEQLPRASERWPDRFLKRVLEPGIDAHVVVGRRSADELARLARIPRRSLITIYNGVHDVALDATPRSPDEFVVGSLGRLHAQKGYDVLLRALARLDGATAVIVGDGEERPALLGLAADLHVLDRLTLPGWYDEARQRLAGFDVFALPSRFEAFPLSIVEAMLGGLPVVASDVGSVSEAVIDGKTGILVPPEDPVALAEALQRLADDPELRAAMGARGRRRALELFTAEAMAARFESLYDEVTS
jgi:glycosyltransferase involved in cell wall biosynthesis